MVVGVVNGGIDTDTGGAYCQTIELELRQVFPQGGKIVNHNDFQAFQDFGKRVVFGKVGRVEIESFTHGLEGMCVFSIDITVHANGITNGENIGVGRWS